MTRSAVTLAAFLAFAPALAAAPADSVMALLAEGWTPDHTAAALQKRGDVFDRLDGTALADTAYPLGSHPVLVVGEWWTDSTAAALNAARDRLRAYVASGGIMVVFYSLHTPCDTRYWTSSWSPVPVYVRLNNASDDCRLPVPRFRDVIVNTDHPLFSGFGGTYIDVDAIKSFSSADPYWYVLAKNREHGLPTIMERRHEKGMYLLVGPAVSYNYGNRHAATYLFDNVITYALSLADQVRQERIAARKRAVADSIAAGMAARERAAAESAAVASAAAEPVTSADAGMTAGTEPAEYTADAVTGPETVAEVEPAPITEDEPGAATEPEPEPEPLPQPPAGDLLPLGEGSTWEFSNEQIWSISGTKSILNRDVAVLNFSAGMGVYFIGRSDRGIMLYGTSEGGVDNIHSAPQLLFKYPAAEGDSYRSEITIGGSDAVITVGGTARQIETDMGVFSCYEYIVEMGAAVQYWYLCPEIGFVRYMNGDDNMVLVDYTIR